MTKTEVQISSPIQSYYKNKDNKEWNNIPVDKESMPGRLPTEQMKTITSMSKRGRRH